MAGIYIHIPFCKQACYYCDFHFSTTWQQKDDLSDAIIKELEIRNGYLDGEPIDTIYFGGGTPSLLSIAQIEKFLNIIDANYPIVTKPEVTLEANPDDLNIIYLKQLKAVGFNRLSIGIQSFNDQFLQFMNRAHTAMEAKSSLDLCRQAGFSNISIDLIYGIPCSDHSVWENDLEEAIKNHPEHISSYALTVEPDTVLGRWKKQNRFNEATDTFVAEQYEMLTRKLNAHGYEQYEVSNFARDHFYSNHNSGYWQQKKYLGVGPSAHSYDVNSRQYNIANNTKYLKSIIKGIIPADRELLDTNTRINEYLMTSLRTSRGCDLNYLRSEYGYDPVSECGVEIEKFLQWQHIVVENDWLRLTQAGMLFADHIASNLFKAG